MRSMFYNYDNHLNEKEYPHCPVVEFPKTLESNSNAIIVKNIKGEEIGVRFHKNSPIILYFNFKGNADGYKHLDDFLNSHLMRFEILEKIRGVITSHEFEGKVFNNTLCVEIKTKEDDALDCGIYQMRLIVVTEDGEYTLFSERDGFLSII